MDSWFDKFMMVILALTGVAVITILVIIGSICKPSNIEGLYINNIHSDSAHANRNGLPWSGICDTRFEVMLRTFKDPQNWFLVVKNKENGKNIILSIKPSNSLYYSKEKNVYAEPKGNTALDIYTKEGFWLDTWANVPKEIIDEIATILRIDVI